MEFVNGTFAPDSEGSGRYFGDTFVAINPNTTEVPATWTWSVIGIVNGIIGSLMTLATFAGQILVFVVVAKNSQLREPGSYYITTLAIADFLISVISMPVWTMFTTLGYWPLDPIWCGVWNVCDFCLCTISINTICVIAIDRYLCLKYTLTYPAKRTGPRMKLALTLTALISIGLYSPATFAAHMYYQDTADPNDCILNYTASLPFTICSTSLSIFIPMAVTLIMYTLILRIARKIAKETVNVQQDAQDKKKRRDDLKAIKTIGVLLLVYIVCWFPVGVALLDSSAFPGATSQWFIFVAYWFGYLNSTLNPICYAIGNPTFRETLRRKVLTRDPMASSTVHSLTL